MTRRTTIDFNKIAFGPDPDEDGNSATTRISYPDGGCPNHIKRHSKHVDRLKDTLAGIDRDIEEVKIVGECPIDSEWKILGSHFRNVRRLWVYSGFNEEWRDAAFPLNWPLELLHISDAGGATVTTPAIVQGRIPHLVLDFTSNLRFEDFGHGKLGKPLHKKERTESGDGDGLASISIPYEAFPCMAARDGSEIFWPVVNPHLPPPRTKTLEIIENDAIDTFQRLALRNPYLVSGLERLVIVSTRWLDFVVTPDWIYPLLFHQMTNLKHLELRIYNHCKDTVSNLYSSFPPNLETLEFHGPLCLARCEEFDEWVQAFGRDSFLPRLGLLRFALDVDGDAGAEGAAEAVARLLDAVARRDKTRVEPSRPYRFAEKDPLEGS